MKGIVFNVFENFVDETFQDDSWDKCLKENQMEDDFFVPTTIYEDQKLLSIFGSLVKMKSLVAEEALKLFGEYLFNALAQKYSDVILGLQTPQDFLRGLDGIIHVEVRKMLSGSTPPQFITRLDEGNKMQLEYRSERKLCALAEGLMSGLNKKFGNTFTFKQIECEHRGDERCLFEFELHDAK